MGYENRSLTRRPSDDPRGGATIADLLREVAAMRRQLDEFFGVYLNARFPYGKPSDRWARRRG